MITAIDSTLPDTEAIALQALSRGFTWLTLLGGKSGKESFLPGWAKHSHMPNRTFVAARVKDYPHCNVGVVSARGVGNVMFWDIDSEGVISRMESETGQPLPDTYITQTRPDTAPHKKHVYFRQTQYSVSRWYKKKNVGQYDIIGIGGASLVRAEGSIADGERVVVYNDSPVMDIPDWLVDWLYQDSRKLQAQINADRKNEEKLAVATKAERDASIAQRVEEGRKVTAEQKQKMYEAGQLPLVSRGYRGNYLWECACNFIKKGMRRTDIETVLAHIAEDYCEGGYDFVNSPEGKAVLSPPSVT